MEVSWGAAHALGRTVTCSLGEEPSFFPPTLIRRLGYPPCPMGGTHPPRHLMLIRCKPSHVAFHVRWRPRSAKDEGNFPQACRRSLSRTLLWTESLFSGEKRGEFWGGGWLAPLPSGLEPSQVDVHLGPGFLHVAKIGGIANYSPPPTRLAVLNDET